MSNTNRFLTKIDYVPLSACVVPDWAFKATFASDEEKGRFIASVKQGTTPLHVAEMKERKSKTPVYEIVDGVHRFEALKELGDERVAVYNHGALWPHERKRVALRFAWSFSHDTVSIARVLQDVQEAVGSDVDIELPFDSEEVDRLLAVLSFDAAVGMSDSTDDDGEDADAAEAKPRKQRKKVATCPHCGKRFNL